MKTFSATEVVDMLDHRITYRQLDYWCRVGAIYLDDDANGSGTRRRFTEPEVDALRLLVTRYNKLNDELEDIRSGKAWHSLVTLQKLEYAIRD